MYHKHNTPFTLHPGTAFDEENIPLAAATINAVLVPFLQLHLDDQYSTFLGAGDIEVALTTNRKADEEEKFEFEGDGEANPPYIRFVLVHEVRTTILLLKMNTVQFGMLNPKLPGASEPAPVPAPSPPSPAPAAGGGRVTEPEAPPAKKAASAKKVAKKKAVVKKKAPAKKVPAQKTAAKKPATKKAAPVKKVVSKKVAKKKTATKAVAKKSHLPTAKKVVKKAAFTKKVAAPKTVSSSHEAFIAAWDRWVRWEQQCKTNPTQATKKALERARQALANLG